MIVTRLKMEMKQVCYRMTKQDNATETQREVNDDRNETQTGNETDMLQNNFSRTMQQKLKEK